MKKHLLKVSIIGALATAIAAIVIVVTTYVLPVRIPLLSWIGGYLPAAKVGGYTVSFHDVRMNTEATKTFYESQDFKSIGVRIDFETDDGKKRLRLVEKEVLNKLIENAVIEDLVDDVGKKVDAESVKMELERTLGTGDIDVARKNAAEYGWDLETFAEQIIRPSIYQKRLLELFQEQNGATVEQRDHITKAQKMISDGRTFTEAAIEYSQASSAKEGGFEGFFERTQLHPDIAEAVFDIEVRDMSDILETPLGLHLFFVVDERVASDGGRTMVSLQHIFVSKKPFGRYLHDQMSKRSIQIWLSGYTWRTDSQTAIFDDPEMISFEEEMRKEALQAVVASSEEKAKEGVSSDSITTGETAP